MRVYIPNEERNKTFTYPDEMARIMEYLSGHGLVNVPAESIEHYYRVFSDEKYSAGWICVDSDILPEFANWLSEWEV